MKIAYILDTFPSVTETFIAREIEALRRHGLTIEVFALNAGISAHPIEPLSPRQRIMGAIERVYAKGTRPIYFSNLGTALWRKGSMSGQFEGVRHIHAGWASHPAFIAWGVAAASGLPWSFSGHARDLFVEGGSLADKLHAAKFAAVCTRAGEQHLKALAPAMASKVFYSPHGLEIHSYRFHERTLDQGMQLLGVGRLVEKKGFAVLLDALAILQKQGQAFTATIIGNGPLLDILSKQSRRLGLADSVRFTGVRNSRELREAMDSAHCFVMPSIVASDGDRDGLPNVLLEAAACGLPIVASRVGGISDFLDETTARLCEPNNPAALARALQEVFHDKQTSRALSRAARKRVETQFDVDRNIEHLAAALTTI